MIEFIALSILAYLLIGMAMSFVFGLLALDDPIISGGFIIVAWPFIILIFVICNIGYLAGCAISYISAPLSSISGDTFSNLLQAPTKLGRRLRKYLSSLWKE